MARGQERGQLRRDRDARFASWAFHGALEGILTGWVYGRLPDDEEATAKAGKTVLSPLLDGMTERQRVARSPDDPA